MENWLREEFRQELDSAILGISGDLGWCPDGLLQLLLLGIGEPLPGPPQNLVRKGNDGSRHVPVTIVVGEYHLERKERLLIEAFYLAGLRRRAFPKLAFGDVFGAKGPASSPGLGGHGRRLDLHFLRRGQNAGL